MLIFSALRGPLAQEVEHLPFKQRVAGSSPARLTSKCNDLVLVFVITVTYAPSAAASDARSEAAGDAVPSSGPSDNADEAAPPAPEGRVGSPVGSAQE
jgi:hypothetical protein